MRSAIIGILLTALGGFAHAENEENTPATAPECAIFFERIGLEYFPETKTERMPLEARNVADCPMGHMYQLTKHVETVREAEKVTKREQLIGTWFSDDMLAFVTGYFIPVYEVLEIERGDSEDEVKVSQFLYRKHDPSDSFFVPRLNGFVDIPDPGRIAILGEHRLRLDFAGALVPLKIRYFDFPVEMDRPTSLLMKRQMMSFEQIFPIRVRSLKDRIALTMSDRYDMGDRDMTFRKVDPEVLRWAHQIVVFGNLPMQNYPCVVRGIENGDLSNHLIPNSPQDFFEALDEIYPAFEELKSFEQRKYRIKDWKERFEAKALIEQRWAETIERVQDGPLDVFAAGLFSQTPFDCVLGIR